MKKTCMVSGQEFEITPEDLAFYEKMGVPAPTLCPEERRRNRLVFRNLRYLYKRKCDATGKTIITCYPPDCPLKVYQSDYWWSDAWDGLDWGRDFDFSRSFFEQFAELYHDVPVINHYVLQSENCDYINGAAKCRNCYLCFNQDYTEDSYYLQNATHCDSCVDCLGIGKCEWCYGCVNCDQCYALFYSQRCTNCQDSYFLTDCRQCRNCIGCFNLVGKQYHVFNKPVSEEEFEAKKKELQSQKKVKEMCAYLDQFSLQFPKKYYSGHSNENFSGDDIRHLKNSFHCFESNELENCKYCCYVFKSHNCMDYDIFGDNSQWIYNCLAVGINCSHNICCMYTWAGSSNNAYCHLMNACSDCFGCSGLKNKKYCIFNKQYSEQEYFALREKIVEHMKNTPLPSPLPGGKEGGGVEWGSFFPPSMTPFPYNQTVASEYLPLSESEAEEKGFLWEEKEDGSHYSGELYEIPDTIFDVGDEVLDRILTCSETRKHYRIVKPELDFYRRMKLPIPTLCPEIRHQRRLEKQNLRKLYERQCEKCEERIETTYGPERKEKVYCEECYLESLS